MTNWCAGKPPLLLSCLFQVTAGFCALQHACIMRVDAVTSCCKDTPAAPSPKRTVQQVWQRMYVCISIFTIKKKINWTRRHEKERERERTRANLCTLYMYTLRSIHACSQTHTHTYMHTHAHRLTDTYPHTHRHPHKHTQTQTHTFFSQDIHSLQAHQVWQLVNDFLSLTTSGFIDTLDGPSLPVCPVYIVTCTQKLL